MTSNRAVQHCRWATATVFLEFPHWLESSEFPWSCFRTGKPTPMDEATCRDCPNWAARAEETTRPESSQRRGVVPNPDVVPLGDRRPG